MKKEITIEELLEQVQSISEVEPVLVFGTIGNDSGTNFIEVFEKIKSPNDLHFLQAIKLRARFNSHRYYQGFYFKTDKFDELKEQLEENNEEFADWVRNCKSIKFMKL